MYIFHADQKNAIAAPPRKSDAGAEQYFVRVVAPLAKRAPLAVVVRRTQARAEDVPSAGSHVLGMEISVLHAKIEIHRNSASQDPANSI